MINHTGLALLYDAWCGEHGCTRAEVKASDLQKQGLVLTAFADSGKLKYKFPGQTAFIYLVEVNEIGGGTTIPPIVSVKGADYSNSWREWFPGLPPLQFVSPICVCREFFEIDVDNKFDPNEQPISGNIEVSAHFILARPPYKKSNIPKLY